MQRVHVGERGHATMATRHSTTLWLDGCVALCTHKHFFVRPYSHQYTIQNTSMTTKSSETLNSVHGPSKQNHLAMSDPFQIPNRQVKNTIGYQEDKPL